MERNLKLGIAGAGLALLMGTQAAFAGVALDPQLIQYGSFAFVPTLKTYAGYDDNLYNFSVGEVGSYYLGVSPSFMLLAQERYNAYRLNYELDGRTYSHKSDDSYLDHNLSATAHVEPNGRLRLDGGIAYKMLHDARGTGRSSGFTHSQILGTNTLRGMGEVDKYDVLSADGKMEYGAKDARGMVVASLGVAQKRYDRAAATPRDNDQVTGGLGFHVRVLPKTKATLEWEHVDTNYDGTTADTVDDRYYAGLVWENTVQTTGKLRLGKSKRDVSGAKGRSKFSWDAGLVWSPVERDVVTLMTGSKVGDSDTLADSSVNTSYSVAWKHDWAERLNSEVGVAIATTEYQNAAGAKYRTDDTNTYRAGLNYQMRRWLVLNGGVELTNRDSNAAFFDSDRTIYTVGAHISL